MAEHVLIAVYTLDRDASWFQCSCGIGFTPQGAAMSANSAEWVHDAVRDHLAGAKDADPCPTCGAPLRYEWGQVSDGFQLGLARCTNGHIRPCSRPAQTDSTRKDAQR